MAVTTKTRKELLGSTVVVFGNTRITHDFASGSIQSGLSVIEGLQVTRHDHLAGASYATGSTIAIDTRNAAGVSALPRAGGTFAITCGATGTHEITWIAYGRGL